MGSIKLFLVGMIGEALGWNLIVANIFILWLFIYPR
jgi:hypothetical protein